MQNWINMNSKSTFLRKSIMKMIFFRNAKGILLTLHLLADIQSGICSKTIYIYIY